ncbi:hypothetical protein D6D13_02198 [Aureobasidium pullulans]|uniref:Uncharacterized protein n=2 Tax=Aureobasidium pullulans TaxID=5580 RepID=A0A4V4JH30_AURPU|nr:hypothetical protein D6D13_02198 [Aureobasidium pullulans]THX73312.1 hypothetical protein D6D05_07449 [Aureobasidium pullulans]
MDFKSCRHPVLNRSVTVEPTSTAAKFTAIAAMLNMRDTIAAADQTRFDAFIEQPIDGDTMTGYDLVDGAVQIRIVRSKTLIVLAEDTFTDSGLAKQFIAELREHIKNIEKGRANVTERGINCTPEPEDQITA